MKITYIDKNFQSASLELIDYANDIIEDYQARGYSLTLRQLYYQMVARDLIANNQKSYSRLGSILSDARLAGLIDWNSIEDRTRNLAARQKWDNPQEIVKAAHSSYKIDRWQNQEYRPEVWVEKEALAGVIARACHPLDIDYMSCRGYMSQSEMWQAAQRFIHYSDNNQVPIIIHLGDHDPSGIDMTRDIFDRLALFCYGDMEVERIALNWNQIQQYNPPPNPAKITDSRATGYIAEFGKSSWELDALDPDVLVDLVTDTVLSYRDEDLYDEIMKKENEEKSRILKAVEVM